MPHPPRSTPQVKHFAIKLRHDLTPAERKPWTHLRNDQLGVNFCRQHAIGPYIADFCCVEKKLIIELDGGLLTVRPACPRQLGYSLLQAAFPAAAKEKAAEIFVSRFFLEP